MLAVASFMVAAVQSQVVYKKKSHSSISACAHRTPPHSARLFADGLRHKWPGHDSGESQGQSHPWLGRGVSRHQPQDLPQFPGHSIKAGPLLQDQGLPVAGNHVEKRKNVTREELHPEGKGPRASTDSIRDLRTSYPLQAMEQQRATMNFKQHDANTPHGRGASS